MSSRLVWGWLEARVVLFRHGFDHFLRGFWHVFDEFRFEGSSERKAGVQGACIPGEPAKNDKAGMTVFGGTTVLSAILAQSLIIVNLPWTGP